MTNSVRWMCGSDDVEIVCLSFPFGEPIYRIEQQDRKSKKVFVLGVYSSAIHAKWIGPDGNTRIRALAVANEPTIFWRGDRDEASRVISRLKVPLVAGHLEPAEETFNGPSGRALDALYLSPLGFDRDDAWLCDLEPFSCTNASQARAITRAYEPVRVAWGLPKVVAHEIPREFCNDHRRDSILAELYTSQADTLILLGDVPIREFLAHVTDLPQRSLAEFGTSPETYGRRIATKVEGRSLEVIPLAHPRQAAALGKASAKWTALHQGWLARRPA